MSYRPKALEEKLPTGAVCLLSQRLQELEEAGIAERQVLAQRPVAVEYSLTPKGLALRQVVEAIQNWADSWDDPAVPAASRT